MWTAHTSSHALQAISCFHISFLAVTFFSRLCEMGHWNSYMCGLYDEMVWIFEFGSGSGIGSPSIPHRLLTLLGLLFSILIFGYSSQALMHCILNSGIHFPWAHLHFSPCFDVGTAYLVFLYIENKFCLSDSEQVLVFLSFCSCFHVWLKVDWR